MGICGHNWKIISRHITAKQVNRFDKRISHIAGYSVIAPLACISISIPSYDLQSGAQLYSYNVV